MIRTDLEDYVGDFENKPLAFKMGFWARIFGEEKLPKLSSDENRQWDEGALEGDWAQFTDSEPAGGYVD